MAGGYETLTKEKQRIAYHAYAFLLSLLSFLGVKSEIPLGIYRHYKGGLYIVLLTFRQSTNGPDDGESYVLYYSLEKKQLYGRRRAQFEERVPLPRVEGGSEWQERFWLLEKF